MNIEKVFIEKFGKIGENFSKDEWFVRLGYFVNGWESALEYRNEKPSHNKARDAIATVRNMCNELPENKVWAFCADLDLLSQQHS